MTEKIRLLLFLHDLAPFGAQRAALYTAKNLPREKFSVTVCSFGGDAALAGEFRKAGAEVAELKAGRYLDLSAWLRLFALLHSFKPDVVQTNLPELSVPVRLMALFIPGVRVLHAVHNPFSSEPWYWRAANLLTFPFCAAVVFSSEGLMGYELADRPGLRARSVAIPNGVEARGAPAGARAAVRKELGLSEGEKVIVCAARLTAQKGQDLLIRAVSELSRRGKELRLLLAGDGEERDKLEKLSAGSGLEDKVIFLGRRSDIGSLLAAADIYAAPSRWESFDIALGEAMLAGLPCTGTAIPGHADLLKDGVTGLSVPAEDPSALAAAIEKILGDPAGAARRAAAARELVNEKFGTAGMARKYEKIYMGLAGGAPL